VPDVDRYKTYSLETSDLVRARNLALDHEVELRFKIKHEMPVFDKSFSQVAKEYSDFQKQRADAGEITHKRWKTEEGYIRVQLNPYVGSTQITAIGADKWKSYPLWRRGNGKGRHGDKVSDWTIRAEMATFKSVMLFAAGKKYIPRKLADVQRAAQARQAARRSLHAQGVSRASTPSLASGSRTGETR
jgi:hypothetical protein